jgi:type II restriction enzyme
MSNKLVPSGYEQKVRQAVKHYWQTLGAQAKKQGAVDSDRGNRAAVTGGKQMNGFCELVAWLVAENGMPDASIFVRSDLVLPGYFRPTKKWDLLVVHQNQLVAAIEFKSQVGPSFGNNFNNRTEEALGTATDLWTAYREGAFGKNQDRPWVGWLMFLEDCTGSSAAVDVAEPHFKVFDDFRAASYAKRYELMLRKLMLEKLYDGATLLLSSRDNAKSGAFNEPASDLTMKRFLAALAGHVQTVLGS